MTPVCFSDNLDIFQSTKSEGLQQQRCSSNVCIALVENNGNIVAALSLGLLFTGKVFRGNKLFR